MSELKYLYYWNKNAWAKKKKKNESLTDMDT